MKKIIQYVIDKFDEITREHPGCIADEMLASYQRIPIAVIPYSGKAEGQIKSPIEGIISESEDGHFRR